MLREMFVFKKFCNPTLNHFEKKLKLVLKDWIGYQREAECTFIHSYSFMGKIQISGTTSYEILTASSKRSLDEPWKSASVVFFGVNFSKTACFVYFLAAHTTQIILFSFLQNLDLYLLEASSFKLRSDTTDLYLKTLAFFYKMHWNCFGFLSLFCG